MPLKDIPTLNCKQVKKLWRANVSPKVAGAFAVSCRQSPRAMRLATYETLTISQTGNDCYATLNCSLLPRRVELMFMLPGRHLYRTHVGRMQALTTALLTPLVQAEYLEYKWIDPRGVFSFTMLGDERYVVARLTETHNDR